MKTIQINTYDPQTKQTTKETIRINRAVGPFAIHRTPSWLGGVFSYLDTYSVAHASGAFAMPFRFDKMKEAVEFAEALREIGDDRWNGSEDELRSDAELMVFCAELGKRVVRVNGVHKFSRASSANA